MKAFIEGVRKEPCLWNPLHPDYREMHAKEWAWQRVVEHYNNRNIPNVQVAKIEWKKLRDNHRDALKRAKLGKNKLLPAQITTWKYAKAMQFLEPHMKYRITENIEMEPPAGSSQNNSEHDVSTTESPENVQTDNSSNKRRCVERTEYRQDTDALESFFNCILKSTQTMPQWMQTRVKKKIFAVIIEAEEHLSLQEKSDTPIESKDTILPIETEIKNEVFSDSCED
ncbi:uncharacterized protein [Epargyreus clarus]|uniref:uncharacterized protein n=1 Tax=Epargyreus clarus TaxID=520877 RepID=UPI003C304048